MAQVQSNQLSTFHKSANSNKIKKHSKLSIDLTKTMGVNFTNHLFVDSIENGSQCCQLGVERGWRLVRLGNNKVKNLKDLNHQKKSYINASKELGSNVSRCDAFFEKPVSVGLDEKPSAYSSIKNAPLNRLRRDHNEQLSRYHRRKPEGRSLQTTNEYFIATQKKPHFSQNKNPPTHSYSHLPAWSPASFHAPFPDSNDIEKANVSVLEEVHDHERAKEVVVAESQSIPAPMPFPLEPELKSMGSTVDKVEGVERWQRSRAPIRRPKSHKPERLLEVLCGGVWKAAVLEEDHDSYRRYILLESNISETVEYHEMNHRVRKLGSNPVRARAFCFLCGHKAGLTSLPMHFQKCLLKWDRRVALPLRHGLELFDPRSLPQRPGKELDLYNERAEHVFEEFVKPRCPGCGKGFFLDCLISHVKECCNTKPRTISAVMSKYAEGGYRSLAGDIFNQREEAASWEKKLQKQDLFQQLRRSKRESKTRTT